MVAHLARTLTDLLVVPYSLQHSDDEAPDDTAGSARGVLAESFVIAQTLALDRSLTVGCWSSKCWLIARLVVECNSQQKCGLGGRTILRWCSTFLVATC